MSCLHCNKTNFDSSSGCSNPIVFSPAVGDWICSIALDIHVAEQEKLNSMLDLSTESGDNSQ